MANQTMQRMAVSTHSRAEAAANGTKAWAEAYAVSTHSRAEAAAFVKSSTSSKE